MRWWRRKRRALWVWEDELTCLFYNLSNTEGSYLWYHYHPMWRMTHPHLTGM